MVGLGLGKQMALGQMAKLEAGSQGTPFFLAATCIPTRIGTTSRRPR